MPKYYTPKEANETLIMVRPMIEELMRIAEKVRAHQPELWVMVQKSAGNGGNLELSKLLKDFDRLDELIHKVQDMGIQIKDLVIGLIDFPAWHEGREVGGDDRRRHRMDMMPRKLQPHVERNRGIMSGNLIRR